MIDNQMIQEMALVQKKELQESSQFALDFGLATFGIDVLVNNIPKKIVLNSKKNRDGNEKVAFAPIGDLDIGDEIRANNQGWLVTSYPTDTDTHVKVTVKRCNNIITVPQKTIKVQVGQDWRNIPKYEEQKTDPVDIPCVVEDMFFANDSSDKAINLPQGQIMITLPYNQYSKNIKLDFNFDMFGDKYKVVRIGRNHIISERGILVLTCELEN